MDDYTPTTEEVRLLVADGRWNTGAVDFEGFNRWLASVRADAWDEGARDVMDAYSIPGEPSDGNPYRSEKQ